MRPKRIYLFSLSKKIKNSVKTAIKFVNNFEQTAADIGIANHYDYVVCGHIHQPEIREITNEHGKILYLNSGDWIENLTALEYVNNEWTMYKFDETNKLQLDGNDADEELDDVELFDSMLADFNLMRV